MNWYYTQGDQRLGPISEAEFEALIASGTITEETLVWKEGMANWTPLKAARAPSAPGAAAPPGWIRCTATGGFFPPEQIVYIEGKPYSAAAKPAVLQGVMQGGAILASDIERIGPPWERRAELGFFRAVWQTIFGVLIQPGTTFTTMKRQGGLGAPLGYFILVAWASILVFLVYGGLVLILDPTPPAGETQPPSAGEVILNLAVVAISAPLFIAFLSFVGSGILHLSLLLCQGARQPFETTYRTYCYVVGSVAALLLVPGCGFLAAPVWAIVSMSIGLARTHEVPTGRAVLAVLLPRIICCVGQGIILFVFFGVILAALAALGGAHH